MPQTTKGGVADCFIAGLATQMAQAYNVAETVSAGHEHWLAPDEIKLWVDVHVTDTSIEPVTKRKANGQIEMVFKRSQSPESERLVLDHSNLMLGKTLKEEAQNE